MSELLHSPDAELAALKARVARLERLEEQVYFQERTLSALNEAITLQQRQLDDLQGRMEAVEEKFRELWELVATKAAKRPCPSHYMSSA
ncbi:MAG: SlyX family protein [Bilophila wadsworthia]